MDLFDETLAKKIVRLEKWICRLQKEMFFLKEVYNLTQRKALHEPVRKAEIQSDMFAS